MEHDMGGGGSLTRVTNCGDIIAIQRYLSEKSGWVPLCRLHSLGYLSSASLSSYAVIKLIATGKVDVRRGCRGVNDF